MKLAEQQRKIKCLIVITLLSLNYFNGSIKVFKSYTVYLRPICCIKQTKRAGIERKETCSYRLMSFEHGAVGGAINSPPVIGPRSARDTSSCPITYEFMGLVYENTQSEAFISS